MSNVMKQNKQHARRAHRVRSKVQGTTSRPRISVFRSNKFLYAQLIDDTKGVILGGVSSKKNITSDKASIFVGKSIADIAKKHNISTVVFDRGGYAYTGIIKELADEARANGLVF